MKKTPVIGEKFPNEGKISTFSIETITTPFAKSMKRFKSPITGHLDIFVIQNEDEVDGEKESWNEVLIHGNPEGLRSLATLLLKLADMNQESNANLPIGAREHEHLRRNIELSDSSDPVIVGRLDAKGTGDFYSRYIAKKSQD